MGCSTPPIQAAFKRLGLKRPAKQRPGTFAGENNPAWDGGKALRSDGYVRVWTPSGNRLEHQIVMERHIGRALTASEIVHHVDGNRSNNSIENLELMTQSQHAALHAPGMVAARNGHKGASNPRAKLSEDQVACIKVSPLSSRSLGVKHGVHPSTIQRIKNGKGWTNGK